MKKHLFLLFILLNFSLMAQRPEGGGGANRGGGPGGFGNGNGPKIGRVYGRILDPETRKGVGYASVTMSVSRGKKDSVVAGALTEENGDFNMDKLGFGRYKFKVSFLGFKEFTKMVQVSPPDNIEQDLGNMTLEFDAKALAEVNVNAEKSQSQLTLDKQVFNVGRNAASVGGTAEDVLKAVPSVTLDSDGNAKLRNNGTTVYVDGRPTMMSLNQIPADQIEKVEIITNPSSKYEAQTSGGIINIISKQNKKPGYNGFLTLGIATGERKNGTFSLSVKQGKANFTGFYNGNFSNQPTNGYTNRTNFFKSQVSNYFDQVNNSFFQHRMQNAMANLEYQVNNRNSLIFGTAYRNGMHNMIDNQNFVIRNAAKDTLIKGLRTILPENEFTNFQGNVTWKKSFPKKDKSLVTDLMYNRGFSDNTGTWTTTETFPKNGKISEVKNLISGGNTSQGYVFQLDFTNPLNDSTKVEMGVRSAWTQRDQQYYNDFVDENGKNKRLDEFTQDFLLNDNINAAYINYSSKFKNRIAYQAGIRYEQSNLNANSRIAGKDFGYNYPSSASDILKAVFPSIYFSKKLKNNTEAQFNISRKINRPNWMQTMPVIRMADRQNTQIGNPSLKPEFISLVEFNYNKMFKANNWLFAAYLRNEENVIVPFSSPTPSDSSVLLSTFVNGERGLRYGIDNTLKLEFSKKLEITTNINAFNLWFRAQDIEKNGFAANAKVNAAYKFPKDISTQISANYESPRIFLQGNEAANYFMDFSLKKDFTVKELMPSKTGMAGNARLGSLTFSINDVFNTRRNLRTFETAYFIQDIQRRRDLRFYKVTLQVYFGKQDAMMFKKRSNGRPQERSGGGMEEF